jgi:hypothetical protein
LLDARDEGDAQRDDAGNDEDDSDALRVRGEPPGDRRIAFVRARSRPEDPRSMRERFGPDLLE